jgi:hypothetical protein
MEAASALTALVNEESSEAQAPAAAPEAKKKEETADEAAARAEEEEDEKRFIPEHKKPDAALTFPEKVRKRRSRGVLIV